MTTEKDMVLVGAITGAHGIRGEVKLRSFTADPADIAGYSPLETAKGAKIEIAKIRPQKGVTDRNAAEALRGTELFVPRARLPEPEEDEVYVHDLVGLPVHLADGTRLGDVVDVADYGAGDLIDVKIDGRKDTVLIPFASQYVLEADGGKVVVDLPEGYLDVEEKR
jgi:16S rRNA processing protein RimM